MQQEPTDARARGRTRRPADVDRPHLTMVPGAASRLPRKRWPAVDVDRLLRDVVATTDCGNRSVTVIGDACIAAVDSAMVRTVIGHLLDCQVALTPEGTNLWVAAIGGSHGVVLTVEDDAPVGAPTTTPDTAREPGAGSAGDERAVLTTVLGRLAAVARLVRLHGGRAWIEPVSGGDGTCFVVDLPVPGGVVS